MEFGGLWEAKKVAKPRNLNRHDPDQASGNAFPLAGNRRWLVGILLSVVVVGFGCWWVLLRKDPLAEIERMLDQEVAVERSPQLEAQIVAFCGDCHAVPLPGGFPRDRWHEAVRLGFEFYARSGRTDLDPPPVGQTIAYYRDRAPERFVFPQPAEATTPLPTRFVTEHIRWDSTEIDQPAISHLRWGRLQADQRPVLLASDMRDGAIMALDLQPGNVRTRLLARLNHPARIELCDLDGDGIMDLVVADLGSFYASDHDRGRVVWLRGTEGGQSYEPIVLADGLGRVADVRSVDLDGNGMLDLIVSVFGHYRTGGILLLRNVTPPGEMPRFEVQPLDDRSGTIHTPPHDFTGDGRIDFAAVVSQAFECVDLFINQGDGRFHLHGVWAGPDLTFGCSGLELVDLNQNGKMDLLLTNGDSFDNLYANPSHGIQWFENLGDLQFAHHRLTDLPGAYRALAGDFDLDGDLDIIATAWLPRQVLPVELRESTLTSIILLEQTSPGQFVRHTLETGSPWYAAMEVGDFDGDGDLDFAVGWNASLDGIDPAGVPHVTVWWNQAIADE